MSTIPQLIQLTREPASTPAMRSQRFRQQQPSWRLWQHQRCEYGLRRLTWLAFLLAVGIGPATAFSQNTEIKFPKAQTARDLYSQAAASLLAKDIPQATIALSKLVDQFPQDEMAPLAAMRLAQCHMTLTRYADAITVLEKWLPELSRSTKARLLDPAAELDAQALLARAYLMAGQHQQVLSLSESISISITNPAALTEAQQRAVQQIKSFAAAAAGRREASQAGPLRQAARLVKDKQYKAAHAELDQVDTKLLNPDWKWRYHVLAAQCQLGLGKAPLATEQLKQIELNGLQPKEQTVVRMLRMEAALAAGALSDAEKELEALSDSAHNDAHQAATLDLRRTELALLRKDREAVQRLASNAKEKYPNFESLHEFDLMLARNMLARVEFDEARQLLTTLIDHPPANDPTAVPRAQWLIGESYLLAQDYSRAIEAYTQVITSRHAPLWIESALMQRGKCHEMLGQVSEAQNDYQRLIQDYPTSTLSADARGRINQLAPINR